ncbi:MAG: MarR family transcriptional regulator [Pseudomonadales bacterium]|nr:MarR family transcriptional regulator [Pseudomonadales bacterium]
MAKADQSDLLFSYFTEIGIIAQLSATMFERQLPQGLSLAQFSVLNWFTRVDDEATPSRLARAFQVTGGAMTNTLGKLQSKGLIKVEPDPLSGRKKRVTMTEAGRRLREKAISEAMPLFTEHQAAMDMQIIERQLLELQEIRQYLDEYRYRDS